jgi:hypothetical protein
MHISTLNYKEQNMPVEWIPMPSHIEWLNFIPSPKQPKPVIPDISLEELDKAFATLASRPYTEGKNLLMKGISERREMLLALLPPPPPTQPKILNLTVEELVDGYNKLVRIPESEVRNQILNNVIHSLAVQGLKFDIPRSL